MGIDLRDIHLIEAGKLIHSDVNGDPYIERDGERIYISEEEAVKLVTAKEYCYSS